METQLGHRELLGKHCCRICNGCWPSSRMLSLHEATHTKKPFRCRFCGKAFRNSLIANAHGFAFHKHELKGDQKQQYFKVINGEKPSRKMGKRDLVKSRHGSKLAGGIDATGNYLCACGFGFQRKRRLKQHQMYCQIHTNRVTARESRVEKLLKKSKSGTSLEFHCDKCSSTFISMEFLQEHKSQKHIRKKVPPNRAPNSDSRVDISRMVTRSSIKRALTKKKYIDTKACSICGKILMKKRLSLHLKQHFVAILNAKYQSELKSMTHVLYLCRYKTCNRAFLNKNNLSSHELVHLGSKPFMCDLCDKPFRTESHHEKHVSTCMQQLKELACWYCSKLFGKIEDLDRHQTERHVQRKKDPFYCGHCSINFPTRPELDQHHFKVHQHLMPQSKAVFECMFCPMQMPSKSDLLDHLQSDHWSEIGTNLMDGLSSELTDDKKQWKCSQCTQTFNQKIILTEHEKIHSTRAPYKCNICEQPFILIANLTQHSRKCRSAVANNITSQPQARGQFQATEESKTFDQKIILTELEKQRRAQVPFKCNLCERPAYKLIMNLLQHTEVCPSTVANSTAMHEEATGTLKATEERQTFDQNIIFTEHKKSHSKQAPFKCKRCEQSFKFKTNLKQHSRKCRSAVANSTAIHQEATGTVEATQEQDEDTISFSSSPSPSSSPSSSPCPSPCPSPPVSPVQIQQSKPVPVGRPWSIEVHDQITVPRNGNCAVTASSLLGTIIQPNDKIYLIQYSSEHNVTTRRPLSISLPDNNTSRRSAIRILPPGVSPSVPIPVKLERLF